MASSQSDRADGRPKATYVELIKSAIRSHEGEGASLQEIYDSIQRAHPYFSPEGKGWKNSVRHTLSLNPAFVNIPRAEPQPGKGGLWRIDPTAPEIFTRKRNKPRSGEVRVRPSRKKVRVEPKLEKHEDEGVGLAGSSSSGLVGGVKEEQGVEDHEEEDGEEDEDGLLSPPRPVLSSTGLYSQSSFNSFLPTFAPGPLAGSDVPPTTGSGYYPTPSFYPPSTTSPFDPSSSTGQHRPQQPNINASLSHPDPHSHSNSNAYGQEHSYGTHPPPSNMALYTPNPYLSNGYSFGPPPSSSSAWTSSSSTSLYPHAGRPPPSGGGQQHYSSFVLPPSVGPFISAPSGGSYQPSTTDRSFNVPSTTSAEASTGRTFFDFLRAGGGGQHLQQHPPPPPPPPPHQQQQQQQQQQQPQQTYDFHPVRSDFPLPSHQVQSQSHAHPSNGVDSSRPALSSTHSSSSTSGVLTTPLDPGLGNPGEGALGGGSWIEGAGGEAGAGERLGLGLKGAEGVGRGQEFRLV